MYTLTVTFRRDSESVVQVLCGLSADQAEFMEETLRAEGAKAGFRVSCTLSK